MKIYFDENFSPRLVEGLRAFQAGVPNEGIEVLSIAETFGQGTADEIWIPKVAQQHAIAVTQDLNIHRRRHQWELCQHYKIGAKANGANIGGKQKRVRRRPAINGMRMDEFLRRNVDPI